MTPADRTDLMTLGKLAGAVAQNDRDRGLELSDRLVGLLGNPSDTDRAAQLRELADLLTDFGQHLRGRADELTPVIIEGSREAPS